MSASRLHESDPAAGAPAGEGGIAVASPTVTIARSLRPAKPSSGSNRPIVLSAIFLGLMFALAVVGPLLAPYEPTKSLTKSFAAPSGEFLLGADNLGRDVLSRLLAGGINLAWMVPAASVIGVATGALLGILAAYYGGIVDTILMRSVDILLAFPAILLVLIFVSVLGPRLWLITVLTGVSLAPGVARVIRGSALAIRKREYVQWAVAAGFPSWRIILRDFIPNLVSPLAVEFGIRLMWSIGGIASISFLGFGVQAPTPDWGLMVTENKSGLTFAPLGVIAPMVAILAFSLACNLLVESIGRKVARTR